LLLAESLLDDGACDGTSHGHSRTDDRREEHEHSHLEGSSHDEHETGEHSRSGHGHSGHNHLHGVKDQPRAYSTELGKQYGQ
jgi:hypothetical protein